MRDEATTPDLVAAARRLIQATNRRDVDAIVSAYASDAVFDPSPLGLEGVFDGRDAIRRVYEDLLAPYEDLEIVLEELRDLGNGVTLSVSLSRGRLQGSSAFLELRLATVAAWANGLVERITWYPDIDEARAAAERLAEERG